MLNVKLLGFGFLLTILTFLTPCTPVAAMTKTSSIHLQAVVVRTAGWNTCSASLQRYERKDIDSPWIAADREITAVVGRNGMGWGTGIHPRASYDGPLKREGDGRSPAGIFLLSSAFGYASADEFKWIRLPYWQATADIHCVDDPGSPYYNKLIDTKKMKPAWQSYESMRRQDDLYRLGIVVEHNADPAIAGHGSCIFLHIWKGPSRGTSGCTAIEAQQLEKLLLWLDPNAMPILIQLPESEYVRFHSVWQLP